MFCERLDVLLLQSCFYFGGLRDGIVCEIFCMKRKGIGGGDIVLLQCVSLKILLFVGKSTISNRVKVNAGRSGHAIISVAHRRYSEEVI